MVSPYTPNEVFDITTKIRPTLQLKARFYHFKKYRNTFLGSELVAALMRHRHATSLAAATDLSTRMLELGCIRHVAKKHRTLNKQSCYVFSSSSFSQLPTPTTSQSRINTTTNNNNNNNNTNNTINTTSRSLGSPRVGARRPPVSPLMLSPSTHPTARPPRPPNNGTGDISDDAEDGDSSQTGSEPEATTAAILLGHLPFSDASDTSSEDAQPQQPSHHRHHPPSSSSGLLNDWRWQASVARRLAGCETELQRIRGTLRMVVVQQQCVDAWLRVCLILLSTKILIGLVSATAAMTGWLTTTAIITFIVMVAGAVWSLGPTFQRWRWALQYTARSSPASTSTSGAPSTEGQSHPNSRSPQMATSTGTTFSPFSPMLSPSPSMQNTLSVKTLQQFCETQGLKLEPEWVTSAGACIVVDAQDLNHSIAFASQGFLDMTGYEKTELEGRDVRFLRGPATPETSLAEFETIIRERREGPLSLLHYGKSGVPFLNQLYLAPLPDAKGVVRYYLAAQGAPAGDASSTASFSTKSSDSLDSVLGSDDEACVLPASVPCTVPDPTHTALKIAVLDSSFTRTTAVYFPNTGELIPFDTDTFKGVVHCRTRTPGDAYFMGKRRAFEIQIQGQFKRRPKGMVWFGAEVPHPMTLGLIKKAACSVLLKLVAAFGHRAHVSFAEGRQPGDMPHIVCPALSAMDRVIVTPPGCPLPALGENFPQTDEMAAVKALQSQPQDFKLDHTYTMSFYSHYIDFERWAVVEIPGFGALDLHGFWTDMSLRFVCYAHPADRAQHLVQERDPILQFEIVHQSLPRYNELPMPHYAPPSPGASRPRGSR